MANFTSHLTVKHNKVIKLWLPLLYVFSFFFSFFSTLNDINKVVEEAEEVAIKYKLFVFEMCEKSKRQPPVHWWASHNP